MVADRSTPLASITGSQAVQTMALEPNEPEVLRDGASTYPQVLPAAPDPEPLAETLHRTGYRASLALEYLEGRAPGAQQSDGQARPDAPDYYGLPAIKKPEWRWYIPAYFLTGGISSGAYLLAAI